MKHDNFIKTLSSQVAAKTGCMLFCTLIVISKANAGSSADLMSLSIEELSNIEVTSVFKRPEPIAKSPAAVFVITQDEIRRSGATSLMEALRLAPNLQVAQVDASSYAISARGFNTFQASNKLLVLVDGRSVYTPLHAGVYWDQQQLLLNDIERIEVVSGPGGTLWGSNAVNGVINVITQTAQKTNGALVNVRAGALDESASARVGGSLGESGAIRAYAFGFKHGNTEDANGIAGQDDWRGMQTGFRSDWYTQDGSITVQGDAFQNTFDQGDIRGGNLLARWNSEVSDHSHLEVQGYYDKVHRDVNRVFDALETLDLEAHQSVSLGRRNELVWGAGHRVTRDKFVNDLNVFKLVPEGDTVQLSHLFVQDTMALTDGVALTIGSKFEYSTFNGLESLPSARVSWRVSDRTMLWTAVSRAVRTPSRLDRELTAVGILDQAEGFDSEVVIAYETGIRGQISQIATWSLSLFYNDYDKLRMLVRNAGGRFQLDNAMHGDTYGAEFWSDFQATDWWRLSGGMNLLEKRLTLAPNAFAGVLDQHAGNDPRRQFLLRSSMDLTRNFEFDLDFRAVDDLPNPAVPSYTELNARLGWKLSDRFELALSGINLLNDRHAETGALPARREISRSAHLDLTWVSK